MDLALDVRLLRILFLGGVGLTGRRPEPSPNRGGLMSGRSESELRSLLLARAGELTGIRAERLVDDDGDVALGDSPFNIWGRLLARETDGRGSVAFVMTPLMELQPSEELDDLVKRTLAGRSVHYQFGANAIQLFGPHPTTVLDRQEDFRAAFASMVSVGKEVIDAVQPKLGGLTSEQHRVLAGWRGVDDQIDADLRAVLGAKASELLAHGWDPRRESLPLLVSEESVPEGWARRFVTVDAVGAIRFRASVPGVREGARGTGLTIHGLHPDTARIWAGRVGIDVREGKLRVEDVLTLAGRSWQELMDAMSGLPGQGGDGWEPGR